MAQKKHQKGRNADRYAAPRRSTGHRAGNHDKNVAPLAGGPKHASQRANQTEKRLRSSAQGFFIWGSHACEAAIKNPERRCLAIYATARMADLVKGWCAAAHTADNKTLPKIQIVEKDLLDRLDHGQDKAVHQGIALEVLPLESPDLTEMIMGQHDLRLLILDQVTDPRNVGAILRSARAFGVDGLVMTSRHAPEENGLLARAAVGALENVPIIRVGNLARALDAMKEAHIELAGLAANGTTMLDDLATSARLGLILGAEGDGMRRLTREACDHLCAISMHETSESLNVSVAAGIALYATCRPNRT